MDDTQAAELAAGKPRFYNPAGSPEARERAAIACKASAEKRRRLREERSAATADAREREADGWTTKMQIAFLRELAEGGNAAAAARKQGRTPDAAYSLKARDAAFSALWAEARAQFADTAEARATDMALNGIEKEVVHQGEVRRLRSHSDRLITTVLTRRKPEGGASAPTASALPPGKAGEAARLKFEAAMAAMARKLGGGE